MTTCLGGPLVGTLSQRSVHKTGSPLTFHFYGWWRFQQWLAYRPVCWYGTGLVCSTQKYKQTGTLTGPIDICLRKPTPLHQPTLLVPGQGPKPPLMGQTSPMRLMLRLSVSATAFPHIFSLFEIFISLEPHYIRL